MLHNSFFPPELLLYVGGQAGDKVCHQLKNTPLDILSTLTVTLLDNQRAARPACISSLHPA